MISALLLTGLVLCLAFSVGYAVRRASICAVAAAKQSALHGRHSRMRAFFVIACWAGAVVLPAAWIAPGVFQLSPAYAVTPVVLLGGALFGVGALINGACAFGTLSHLAGGNTSYLATLAGVFGGALAARSSGIGGHPVTASPLGEPSVLSIGIGLFFFSIAASALWRSTWRRRLRPRSGLRIPRIGTSTALLVIGVGGGVLYAAAGEWTYMSILSERARVLVGEPGPQLASPALLGALAALLGAWFAACRAGRFRLEPPRARAATAKFAGGGAMGFAAALIPGGNDVMLVYNLPSAASHALAAYAAMTAVLWGMFRIQAERRRHKRRAGLP